MKKMILISLLFFSAASAPALNFFGIEYNGSTADNILNLIYGLAQGDEAVVDEYYGQLKKTDPSLAKAVDPDHLKVPCSYCEGKGSLDGGRPCPVCQGTGIVKDSQSLGYLQYKFCNALDEGKSEKKAWMEAKTAFDERCAVFLNSEMLTGTVIRKEDGGALLSCPDNDETVYLKGIGSEFPSNEGASVSGEVWLAGTHNYKDEDGEMMEVKCYTATLWMD
ncbi:DnaJ-like cysteine-rich domain-containing protein [Tichowtungia aerotolerans]|uniref:Uncharacterized protein n=1 Tax=Tichowtungia aerotolerans TaxID=2697043 RepID=A0A6P1MBK8_9BACT|nr:hypothetical protein [Tichowtungia aerotolerans]QHI68956.1 hypothetical protein GT409_05665 [Tichowtungia aerotolerans]